MTSEFLFTLEFEIIYLFTLHQITKIKEKLSTQCAIRPPNSSRSLIPRTHPYACQTPMSVWKMSLPTTKQPSTAEPVLLHSPPRNQTSHCLVGTRHPQHRGGNAWAIFSHNPAGTLDMLRPHPAVMCLGLTLLHSTICLKHLFRFRVDNTEHISCHVKTKKEKNEDANRKCKWFFFMATFATWLASSDLCFVPGARWHGPRTVNCKRDYELKWYEVMCTTTSLVAIQVLSSVWPRTVFFLGCSAGTGPVDKGTGFCPALMIWWVCTMSIWRFGFGFGFGFGFESGSGFRSGVIRLWSGSVLWHMYRNQIPHKMKNVNGLRPAFIYDSLLVNISSFCFPTACPYCL